MCFRATLGDGQNLDLQMVAALHLRCHRIIGEQLEMTA
jgi:hypothetical protein